MTEVVYEHPLTEKIRSLLRLEFLFAEIACSEQENGDWQRRHTLAGILDISTILARTDFKGDLVKELDRYVAKLKTLRGRDGVDDQAVNEVEQEVRAVLGALNQAHMHPASGVRESEFLAAVRQRSTIPGGTCSFDLPALQHWLAQPGAIQKLDIDSWLVDLLPLRNALTLLLRLLRESGHTTHENALNGVFWANLDRNQACQLLRVTFAENLNIYPEVSGGKHRVTLRFLKQDNARHRPTPTQDSIRFRLSRCAL